MRIAGVLVVTCLLAVAAGCKTKNDADAAAQDPKAAEAQEQLLKRRDALISARQKLMQDKTTVEQQMHDMTGSGLDTSELQKKLDEIDSKLDNNGSDTSKLLQEEEQAAQRVAGGNANNAEVAAELEQLRELEDAARRREREAAQAIKDAEAFAVKWQGTCSAGTTTIVTTPATPTTGKFTKSDIQGALGRAHAIMNKKGLRSDDLGAAASLESESNKAMGEGDWGRAMGAASQLAAAAEQVKIDKVFILGKFERLKAYVAAHKEAAEQARGALQDITQKFGDQNYEGANRRINELWGQLGH